MTATNRLPIPIAPNVYDRTNEEQTRRSIGDRLQSIEGSIGDGVVNATEVHTILRGQSSHRHQTKRAMADETAALKHRLFGGI
jgi:hypothetical protein